MGFVKEFKDFAMKGNVVDLAVAVIIGGAFQKIVGSLVADIIMPCVGLLLGGVRFSNLFVTLSGGPYQTLAEAAAAGAPTLRYGIFLQTTIDFLIIALAIFVAIKIVNSTKKKEEAAPSPAEPPEDIKLLREIRDSLKK